MDGSRKGNELCARRRMHSASEPCGLVAFSAVPTAMASSDGQSFSPPSCLRLQKDLHGCGSSSFQSQHGPISDARRGCYVIILLALRRLSTDVASGVGDLERKMVLLTDWA
jgi:hypothetical protein